MLNREATDEIARLEVQHAKELAQVRFEALKEMVQEARRDHDAIRDQAGSYSTKIELAALADKVDTQQSILDKGEGRRTVITAVIAVGSSLLVALLGHWLQNVHP